MWCHWKTHTDFQRTWGTAAERLTQPQPLVSLCVCVECVWFPAVHTCYSSPHQLLHPQQLLLITHYSLRPRRVEPNHIQTSCSKLTGTNIVIVLLTESLILTVKQSQLNFRHVTLSLQEAHVVVKQFHLLLVQMKVTAGEMARQTQDKAPKWKSFYMWWSQTRALFSTYPCYYWQHETVHAAQSGCTVAPLTPRWYIHTCSWKKVSCVSQHSLRSTEKLPGELDRTVEG